MAESPGKIETLEKGDIRFFYRPRVEEKDPDAPSDLQQFYMVLNPRASADIFEDMKVEREERPTEPLFQGRWE